MKIIAEICQNHNGNFDDVLQMVKEASENGATHVKIQHIYSRNLTFRPQFEQGLQVDGNKLSIKRDYQTEYNRLKTLELSSSECGEFVKYCRSLNVVPMTTCFTRDLIETIYKEGFDCVKIASYDCASFPMLREASRLFKTIFVSTGATFDHEIKHAHSVLNSSGSNYCFLHCVTEYPTPLNALHLARLEWLSQFSTEIGYSDHTSPSATGLLASKAAIYLGATVVERHFTIKPSSETKDGPVSINPKQLKELSSFAKLGKDEQLTNLKTDPNFDLPLLLGNQVRKLTNTELLNRDYYRGRFASPLSNVEFMSPPPSSFFVYNWEETPLA